MTPRDNVLRLVNAARRELGLPPLDQLPRGLRASPAHCPIALALDEKAEVLLKAAAVPGHDWKTASALARAWQTQAQLDEHYGVWFVSLPEALRRFVTDFDGGNFPELDVEAQPALPPREPEKAPLPRRSRGS
jgi:hypothetical protein